MSKKVQRRILLLIDITAFFLSFVLGYLIRYHRFRPWNRFKLQNDGIYPVILVVCVLLYITLYFYRSSRHRKEKNIPLAAQDPLDIIISVLKTQFFVFLSLLIFLFAVHKAAFPSRMVLGAGFLSAIILDGIFHILFARYLRSVLQKHPVTRNILLVSRAADISHVIHRLQRSDRTLQIKAVLLTDPDDLQTVTDESFEIPVIRSASNGIPDFREEDIHEAFLYGSPEKEEICAAITAALEKQKLTIHHAIRFDGQDAGSGMIGKLGCYPTVVESGLQEKCEILGVRFTPANLDSAVSYICRHLRDLQGKYICFCNVHTTVESHENPAYQEIQNGAALVMADGTPVMQQERRRGFSEAERVAGPDFMTRMFEATMDGKISHYFYGAKEETLQKLKENLLKKYPGIDIRGLYSPPFRPLTEEEDEADIRRINESGADVVWIGLGAPKQEKWMAAHQGKIHGVMMGVGAGFDFHAGTIRRAPVWVQKIGMEWLYRLFQDPRRLIRRYFISNIKFLWYTLKDSFEHPDNGND